MRLIFNSRHYGKKLLFSALSSIWHKAGVVMLIILPPSIYPTLLFNLQLDIVLYLRLIFWSYDALRLHTAENFNACQRVTHLLHSCIFLCQTLFQMLNLSCVALLTILQAPYKLALPWNFLLHLELWSRNDTIENLLVLLDRVRLGGYVFVVWAWLLIHNVGVDYHLVHVWIHDLQHRLLSLPWLLGAHSWCHRCFYAWTDPWIDRCRCQQM